MKKQLDCDEFIFESLTKSWSAHVLIETQLVLVEKGRKMFGWYEEIWEFWPSEKGNWRQRVSTEIARTFSLRKKRAFLRVISAYKSNEKLAVKNLC